MQQIALRLARPLLGLGVAFGLVLGVAAPARAMESAAVRSPRATATLVSPSDSYVPGQPLRLGLRLRIAPGWHTYWKNPGDAGEAPDIQVTMPQGGQAGPFVWPAPQRQAEGPLVTYGYTGDVLLPLQVTPPAGTAPLAIKAHASWLVCANICVPEEGDFQLTLPAGAGAPSAQAALFTAADAAMPAASPYAASIAADGTLTLRGKELQPEEIRRAVFIPDAANVLDNAREQKLTVDDGVLTLRLPLAKPLPGAPAPSLAQGLDGVLLLTSAHGAPVALAIAAKPGMAVAGGETDLSFGRMLVLAFVAGIILNLMPCVFPVLAMKALAIARLSGAKRGHVQAYALSYTLGVLAAFALIGGVMLGLRTAGAAAGWGFQFQSPVFVAGMSWLLFCVGLSLSGVMEVGSAFAGIGHGWAGRHGHVGSFCTGLLAVVVATPCTAPFMGAAIAAALVAPPAVLMSVFLAMGLGLAAPYVMLATVPHMAEALPRPGRWMEITKQALAFPMYGAAAWLLWVVSQEAGPGGVLATAAGLVLLGLAAWAMGLAQSLGHDGADRAKNPGQARRIAQSVALAACLAALAVLSGIAVAPPAAPGTQALGEAGTESFSDSRLAALRAAGKPVFVNMTAAWCITCLLNERVALGPSTVHDAFAARGVTYMKGDWTRQDPAITAFLHAHQRDGVPLYVYYPPGGAPQVLPQILTEGAVLAEIGKSGA